jgi:arsenate reductase
METWLNPECSKCRAAVDAIEAAGAGYTVRRYLTDPPDAAELTAVLDRLGLEPWDIARLGEPAATELGLTGLARGPATRAAWLEALAARPELIQRPIITAADGTTVVGRTPEAIAQALAAESASSAG